MNGRMTVGKLCGKLGMSRQNYYKTRRQRQRKETDGGLTGQPVPAERASQLLLLEPLKGEPKTANSRHSLPVFHNPVKDMVLTGPNQAWTADITYIRTGEGFLYLSLITDMRSRKTAGYHAGDTLKAEGAIKAPGMALAQLPEVAPPVRHSDRGCQYCSHSYVEKLRARGAGGKHDRGDALL